MTNTILDNSPDAQDWRISLKKLEVAIFGKMSLRKSGLAIPPCASLSALNITYICDICVVLCEVLNPANETRYLRQNSRPRREF